MGRAAGGIRPPSFRPLPAAAVLLSLLGLPVLPHPSALAQRPFVVEFDNDALNIGVLGQPSDAEYTSGLRVVIPLNGRSWIGSRFFPDLSACPSTGHLTSCQASSLVVGQQIYMPPSAAVGRAWTAYRPAAGWLGVSWRTAVWLPAATHELIVTMGVTGDPSLAQPAQDWVHDMLGESREPSWVGQLASEPTLDVAYRGSLRPWSHRFGTSSALLLRPTWCLGAGTGRTEVGAGLEGAIGIGQGGGSGWPEIRGAGASAPVYLLGGLSGRMVAGDLYLDGGFLHDGRSVGHEPFVFAVELGAGIRLEGRRIEWRVVRTSPLYPAQDGPHTYTTLAIAQ